MLTKHFFKILFFNHWQLPMENKFSEFQINLSDIFLKQLEIRPAYSNFEDIIFMSTINLFGIFSWDFEITRYRDHAGMKLSFNILFLHFDFSIYDCRHWDYENNCWEEIKELE